jgi:glycosyltransferase involved in cell wall biosynthesis
MPYHIALSCPFDLAKFHRDAQAGKCPRHTMWELSQGLNATVHQPDRQAVRLRDRLLAKLIGQPEHWAMARALSTQLKPTDVVFCTGEDVGFPIAIMISMKRAQPQLAVYILEPNRLRVKIIIRAFRLARSIGLFLTNTSLKAKTLHQSFQIPTHRVAIVREQTDVRFFHPRHPSIQPPKPRPIIASAGLEQRDYATLALATQDLDVDVHVCAVSPNASAKTRVQFPPQFPPNMTIQPLDWPAFRQLYQNADIVVISLLHNTYSAGLTVLMEALACQRPVIITRTPGLAEQFIDAGLVTGVNPNDPAGMMQAIQYLLSHPEVAAAQAERGYTRILEEHTSELYVNDLILQLQELHDQPLKADAQFGQELSHPGQPHQGSGIVDYMHTTASPALQTPKVATDRDCVAKSPNAAVYSLDQEAIAQNLPMSTLDTSQSKAVLEE